MKILKHGIKTDAGKYIRCWYSKGKLTNYPEGTITVYAKDYSGHLPAELKPENETDLMTDYFEKDRARILPTNKYYNDFMRYAK